MSDLKLTSSLLPKFIRQQLDENNIVSLLNGFFHYLRNSDEGKARERLIDVIKLLKRESELGRETAMLLCRWLCQMRLYPLLISNGILAREGFGREMRMRLYEKINPSFKDHNDLRDVFFLLFGEERDAIWIHGIPLRDWRNLLKLLDSYISPQERERIYHHLKQEGLFAAEMLAVWVAAEDLEPELMRLDPSLLDMDSPFIALQREVALWVEARRHGREYDDAHLQVMFTQCRQLVERLHKKGSTAGSSLGVAYLLERLNQTLERLSELMTIFTPKDLPLSAILRLTGKMALATIAQHSISDLWKQSVKMLSRSITQHSGGHGEHYITRDKKEYFAMFYSAAGGGVLIALMALLKIYLGEHIDDKVCKSIVEGLNYGIGFTIIFMLHFTVATKQPAMTAARFADAVERNPQGRAMDMKLARLLVDVWRSQSVAVFGNVLLAVSVAAFIAYVYMQHTGEALLNGGQVDYQLASIDPTKGTLWFAAIAGVWLFCAGIISGYFDNRNNYLNTRQRLRHHPLLKVVMTEKIRMRFADYIHDNSGSIIGNICFGMLLGLTGLVGYFTGLPLDIRHVAFSSANIGYAAVSANLSWDIFIQSVVFVLLIGIVNLVVSFSLTLWIALRSLGAEVESWSNIIKCVWRIIKKRPLSLFFPLQLDDK